LNIFNYAVSFGNCGNCDYFTLNGVVWTRFVKCFFSTIFRNIMDYTLLLSYKTYTIRRPMGELLEGFSLPWVHLRLHTHIDMFWKIYNFWIYKVEKCTNCNSVFLFSVFLVWEGYRRYWGASVYSGQLQMTRKLCSIVKV